MARGKVKTYNQVEDEILKLTNDRERSKSYLAEKINIGFPRLNQVLRRMNEKNLVKILKLGREHMVINKKRR